MLLRMKNIYAGYDGSDVLKGIDIEVERGTTTCIVGPNGAGKSTVLRVLSGLLKPRLGEVVFDDKSLLGLSPGHILALGIVQVPQSHSLFPSMSVQQNVRLGAFTLHDRSLVEHRLHEVEEMFPVVKLRAREKAGNLSGGQQRLVEFARCLMLDPRVILLDEPSMGLDPKTFKQVVETIKVMQGSGRTILLVEQNARTGLSIANNGVVLESGQVRLVGTHTEILNNPEIGRLYLGGTLSNAS
ncbi:MAG: ABC transporter ATP-binding protein [Ktedonobacteraceae bacterium]|nr:ABC transporter ATP-binding protein [Ktedonobacteraceae bacterium]